MSTLNPYLKQYKKNQIETASPEQILILLYDGAINFLNKAKVCLEEGDTEEFHKNMIRCKNIIAEFMDTLDLQQGGQWAMTLYNLYKYLRKLILKSDGSQSLDGIDEVLKHLTSLRDTWLKAIEIAKEERKLQPASTKESSQKDTEVTTYYNEDGSDAAFDGDSYETDDNSDNDDSDDEDDEDDEDVE